MKPTAEPVIADWIRENRVVENLETLNLQIGGSLKAAPGCLWVVTHVDRQRGYVAVETPDVDGVFRYTAEAFPRLFRPTDIPDDRLDEWREVVA